MFIPRGKSKEDKEQIIAEITKRQNLIESTGLLNPVLMFPEGRTTNGSSLVNFKRAAFITEKRVKPIILDYQNAAVHPAFDTI